MTSPAPSSGSASPNPLSSRHSSPVMSSPPPALDPFSHLSTFINSLQKKAKDDSHTITDLKTELDRLKQVQLAQQAEIDAIKAKQDAFGKAGLGSEEVGGGTGNSQGEGNTQPGRKRARSMTDTLEQEDDTAPELTTQVTDSSAILSKLCEVESALLSEVRQNGAAMAGLGESECDCGYVAAEVAEDLGRKIEDVESSLKKAIESKLDAVQVALTEKMMAIQGYVIDAVEDNGGGCECGDVDYAREEIERKLGEIGAQLETVVGGLSNQVGGLDRSILAKLNQIQNAQADLLTKVSSQPVGGHKRSAQLVAVKTNPVKLTKHHQADVFARKVNSLDHPYSPRPNSAASTSASTSALGGASSFRLPPLPSASAPTPAPFVLGSVANLITEDDLLSLSDFGREAGSKSSVSSSIKVDKDRHVPKKAKKRAVKAINDFDDLATTLFPPSERDRDDSQEL